MNFRFAEGITDEMFPFLTEKNHVVSLVGAGGKTTLLYALAEYLRAKGWRVLVTTTTHIWQPKAADGCAGADAFGKNCLPDTSAKKETEPGVFDKKGRAWVTDRAGVYDCWACGAYAVLGLPSEKGKLGPAPEAEFLPLLVEADCVLIEADGAKK